MYLYIFDSDNAYFHALKNAIDNFKDQKTQLYHYSIVDDFVQSIESWNSPSMVLIDLESAESQNFKNWEKLSDIPCLILCDGIISKTLEEVVCSNFNSDDVDELLILKYQAIESIWNQIVKCYISKGKYRSIPTDNATELISIYNPFGTETYSYDLEKWIEKYTDERMKTLLIHYDPFYRNEGNEFNLSFIFSKLSREKKDSVWYISEIVQKKGKGLDCIEGPLHMYDIDYLSEEKLESFIEWLKRKSQYQRIIINFNGVHISKSINKILESSNKCVLLSKSEVIQSIILKQYPYKWNLLSNDHEVLIKELMIYRS